jgi:hypothetical protein
MQVISTCSIGNPARRGLVTVIQSESFRHLPSLLLFKFSSSVTAVKFVNIPRQEPAATDPRYNAAFVVGTHHPLLSAIGIFSAQCGDAFGHVRSCALWYPLACRFQSAFEHYDCLCGRKCGGNSPPLHIARRTAGKINSATRVSLLSTPKAPLC